MPELKEEDWIFTYDISRKFGILTIPGGISLSRESSDDAKIAD